MLKKNKSQFFKNRIFIFKILQYFISIKKYPKYLRFIKQHGLKNIYYSLLNNTNDAVNNFLINQNHNIWFSKNFSNDSYLLKQRQFSKKFLLQPKISVIVPVYNPPELEFVKCVKSVLNQSYQNWELCIVDDKSTNENIQVIIKKYANLDKRIKFVIRKNNGHISKASNTALKISSGNYVALLDHDDFLWPNALYEVVKTINENPQVNFIYSDEDKIDINNKHLDPYKKRSFSPETLLGCNYITHLAVIKKNLVSSIGGFRIGYEGSQDYDLFLRIIRKTNKIVHIPKFLYSWRAIESSVASGKSNVKNYAYDNGAKAITDYLKASNLNAYAVKANDRGLYSIKFNQLPQKLDLVLIGNENLRRWKKFQKQNKNITFYLISSLKHVNKLKFDENAYIFFFNSSILPPQFKQLQIAAAYLEIPDLELVSGIIKSKNRIVQSGYTKINNKFIDVIYQEKIKPYMSLNYTKILANYDAVSLNTAVIQGKIFNKFLTNFKKNTFSSLDELGIFISKKLVKNNKRVATYPYIFNKNL